MGQLTRKSRPEKAILLSCNSTFCANDEVEQLNYVDCQYR